ncbi:Sphingomyelinase C [BD1-7 clade bacterium]|uniref:Sphingomyelinase C n=1 Tax=BD1-7 clade bacterium TaxID=2029982 RepID=A0A5S9QFE7_9GAMM|nr:Sphingomyelinase C [BD1-7 clade bacterium]CAA0117216.1 Sphingomyelinase C [BD1-7 clade bacterium]
MRRTLPFFAALTLASATGYGMSHPPQELDTEIVFTNSTPDTLSVTISGDAGHEQKVTTIAPLATATLANIERVEGISATLNIELSSDNYSIELTQETQGIDLAFGLEAGDLSVSPQSNADIQRFEAELAGRSNQLGFNADQLGAGGKLTYVLQQADGKPDLGPANAFQVLSYNVWATTIFGSKKVDTRLQEMPPAMAGYDALVLTEMFDTIPVNKLLGQLRDEYAYQTGEIFKLGKILPSGTRIVSRWPIVSEQHLKYADCDGIQCAATRGVIYAKINKQGNIYHLFATHTQSSDDTPNRDARLAQLEEMGDFILAMNLPADEPVIMAGDFNINKIGLPADRDLMESLLRATEPENQGHNLSFDSNTNAWAEKPYLEYLDYTLTGNDGAQSASGYQEIFAPRSLIDALWGIWDLSDHYAARGVFTYGSEPSPLRPEFPYFGDVVHFRTNDGHFMRAMNGGGSFVSAGSSQIGTWESFILQPAANGKVAIQARDGHYVRLDSYLLGTLKAEAHEISASATFELVELGNGSVALKADNGKYLRADFGGGAGLSAGSKSVGDNQTFVILRP